MTRTIIHADLDAFYASVEQRDNPDLRGRPVVVGGSPETRGVVAAASYEARRFGVRSAMPMSRALRLCPDAVRVSPRFGRYGEVSRAVMTIFQAVTALVEPLSLDEAFLDVSERVSSGEDTHALAVRLKDDVRASTGLTLSIGAGTNKIVAKIASDIGKPDGLVVVPPGEEELFLAPLPVRTLWGVGPKTEAHLESAGLRIAADLVRATAADVERLLGPRGPMLREMAMGIDDRPVETAQERKSVGAETTFARDLPDGPELRAELARISDEVAARLLRAGVKAGTVALKLRYRYFKTITRQTTLAAPTDDAAEITQVASSLLDRVVEEGDMFRLLGVQCSRLGAGDAEPDEQRELWAAGDAG